MASIVVVVNICEGTQSREAGKDQESLQISTTPDQDHSMRENTQKQNTQESIGVSRFPISITRLR